MIDGDERAFEELDRRHRPAVERHCLRLLRDRFDADEAAQTAMINAYTAMRGGQHPRAFRAWVLAIARNAAFDLMRRRTPDDPIPDTLPSAAARPEDHLIVLEEVRALCTDLDELPDGQRQAMVLRVFADLPHREVARRLGCSEVEARTYCKEARRTLDEFEAGRSMDCAEVRERIAGQDRRALRARRVRAHLRACDPCGDLAVAAGGARGWSRVRGILPLPMLPFMRRLVAGVGATVVAKAGGGMLAVVTTTATVAVLGGAVVDSATHRHPVAPPAVAAATPAAPGGTAPVATRAAGAPAAPAAATPPTGAAASPGSRGPAAASPAPAGADPVPSPPDPDPAPAGGGTAPAPGPSTSPAPAPGGGPAAGGPAAPAPDTAAVTVSVPPVTLPSVTVTPPVPLPPVAVPPVAVSTPGITLPGLVSVPPVTVTTPGISVGPGGRGGLTVALPPLLGP